MLYDPSPHPQEKYRKLGLLNNARHASTVDDR